MTVDLRRRSLGTRQQAAGEGRHDMQLFTNINDEAHSAVAELDTWQSEIALHE